MFNYSYALNGGLGLLLGFLPGLPAMAIGITTYVLTALGLYTMAQNRGIRSAWMAWFPVLDCWILGSLSDQYRYVVKGQIRSRRKVLLSLKIVLAILNAVIVVLAANAVASLIFAGGIANQFTMERVLRPSISAVILFAITVVLRIISTVFYYMSLYDIYHSCDPANSTLYLVFSILIQVTRPFFLFLNRNMERGMPPRRTAAGTSPEY